MLSLAALTLGGRVSGDDAAHVDSDAASCSASPGSGAGKRKGRSTQIHNGISSDSSALVSLIALSRLMKTRETSMIEVAARTPIGAAVLEGLRAAVRRVAVAAGGADAAFSDSNVVSFFNLSGSTIAKAHLYNGGLSLRSAELM